MPGDSPRCSWVVAQRGLGIHTPVVQVIAEPLLDVCSSSAVVVVDAAAATVANVHRTVCETASAARWLFDSGHLVGRPGESKAFLRMLVAALLRSTSDHRDERAARDLPCDCRVAAGVPLWVDLQHGSL